MQQAAELGDENPKEPGEVLGFFSAHGKLTDDTCGAESLRAPDKWSFEVKLSRDGGAFYWLNGREAIVGDIADDNRFAFETHVDVPVAAARGAYKGCTMVRRDAVSGALKSDDSFFDAKLSYAYSEKSGTDCSDFQTGADGMPALLPCRISYVLTAERLD